MSFLMAMCVVFCFCATKMQFGCSKSLPYKTFYDYFPYALLHAKHKLTQLYYITYSTICQVKIVLIIFMYFLQNTTIKHFTHHLFSQTFLCVPFTLCLFAPANILYKNISVQSALCWMYHPLFCGTRMLN